MTDDGLLNWYDPDPDKAREEHHRHYKGLLIFVRRRGIRDAEEAVSEIFVRVATKLAAGTVPQVKSEEERGRFLGGYARKVCQELWKQQQQSREVQLDDSPGGSTTTTIKNAGNDGITQPEKSELRERIRACFAECLGSLKSEDAEMLLEYYRGDKGEQITLRKKLAERLNITMNALALRVQDRRKALRECVNPCLTLKGLRIDDLKSLNFQFME